MADNVYHGGQAKQFAEAQKRKDKVNQRIKMTREGVPEHIILLSIAFDKINGTVFVAGPIANKWQSYMLLNLGRQLLDKKLFKEMPSRPEEDIELFYIAYDTTKPPGERESIGGTADIESVYGILDLARDCIYDWNRENIAGVKI